MPTKYKSKKPANKLTPAFIRKPKGMRALQAMSFDNLWEVMANETASALTDYVRQTIGVSPSNTSEPGSGIFINWDRVLRTQAYQEIAWYDLYDEVEKDTSILASLSTAKVNVVGREYDVMPYKVDPTSKATDRDIQIARFVKQNLDDLENFQQDLYELMDALGKGFAISEIVWKKASDGSIHIDKLMNRPQRRIQFDAVTRMPRIRTMANPYFGDVLPDKKFIVHRCSSKYENPFGDALDQSLYWMWLFKKMVIKFWMKHLEVGTAPIPYVKHPATANDKLKGEALSIAQTVRNGGYGRLPNTFELIFAEAKNMAAANDSFEKFVEMCNNEAIKCINGQTLTTEASGKGGKGARSLGQVHRDTQAALDLYRANGLASTLNYTLIRWCVDANWSHVDGYPRFHFIDEDYGGRYMQAETLNILASAGHHAEPSYVEERFNIPLLPQSEQPVVGAEPSTPEQLPISN